MEMCHEGFRGVALRDSRTTLRFGTMESGGVWASTLLLMGIERKVDMIIAYTDSNDLDFAIECAERVANKVKKAIDIGVSAWYQAAHEDVKSNEYWTAEEIEAMWGDGYAEPTMELLDRWGVECKLVGFKVDEDDNIICDELVRGF